MSTLYRDENEYRRKGIHYEMWNQITTSSAYQGTWATPISTLLVPAYMTSTASAGLHYAFSDSNGWAIHAEVWSSIDVYLYS